MKFIETAVKDAYIIELDRKADERGFFARTFCKNEFEAQGLTSSFVQANTAFNNFRGTLRGMHFQESPYEEIKLVRCTRGALYDVIIDIRSDSPTFKQWIGVELTEDNHRMLYVPEGFAHGYVTLRDNTEIIYQVSEFYTPQAENGIRWDDPQFNIQWPETERHLISEKDRNWPDFGVR